jgi:hypothetical protein
VYTPQAVEVVGCEVFAPAIGPWVTVMPKVTYSVDSAIAVAGELEVEALSIEVSDGKVGSSVEYKVV